MTKEKVIKKISFSKTIIVFLLLMASIFCFFAMPIANTATALSTTYYSNVLDDLQSDENFNVDDYPSKVDDYSLSVIQIAESSDGELFVYVYNPSAETKFLQATSISLSRQLSNDENYKTDLYNLILLNRNGVFSKYKVDNFSVSSDELRYYNITEIYRNFYPSIDAATGNDNVTNEVSFEVAQVWTAYTQDGNVYYDCQKTEVVLIVDRYVGYIRYTSVTGWGSICDSHYIAFSTDYDIDRLLEADVYFVTRTYSFTTDYLGSGDVGVASISETNSTGTATTMSTTTREFGEYEDHVVSLSYDEVVSVKVGFLWKSTYKFNRIESSADFIKNEDLTTTASNNVQNMQYVLRFYESSYVDEEKFVGTYPVGHYESGTEVSSVTILRLKFETDGVVYNLGVVDNKTTGGSLPSNNQYTFWQRIWNSIKSFFASIWVWFKWVLLAIGIIILIILVLCVEPIFNFICKIFKALWKVISWFFKGFWFVIAFPFRLIINNKKGGDE